MSRTAFGRDFAALVDPPVWLVTAAHGGDRGGLIATFVANASLVPDDPRVLVGGAKPPFPGGLIARPGAFPLPLVPAAGAEWARRFGLRSGRDGDKFAGLAPAVGATGAPLL